MVFSIDAVSVDAVSRRISLYILEYNDRGCCADAVRCHAESRLPRIVLALPDMSGESASLSKMEPDE